MARFTECSYRDGSKYYRVQVRVKGYPSTSAQFDKKSDAKAWASKTEYEMKQRIYFDTHSTRQFTLKDLIEKYISEYLPTKEVTQKSKIEQTQRLKWWIQSIGSTLLKDIKPSILNQSKDLLSKIKTRSKTKYSADTINYYLGALSHVFTIAVNQWEIMKDNPMLKVPKAKKPRGRVRFLTEEELHRLIQECKNSANQHLYLIVLVALSTGARKGEIINLRSKDIDIPHSRIILEETKNGERRSIPLKGVALSAMKTHLETIKYKTKPIFPSTKTNKPIDIRRAWTNAVLRAEIKDFRFHDLRHTAASYLAMNGASLLEISEILGHKTIQMVKKYSHLSNSHIEDVVERMNESRLSEV